MNMLRAFISTTIFVAAISSANAKPKLSDSVVKQRIIKQSVAAYPGNCACPYNSASNGSSCGRRSAWSRGGGYAPMCYASDVSKADISRWRSNH